MNRKKNLSLDLEPLVNKCSAHRIGFSIEKLRFKAIREEPYFFGIKQLPSLPPESGSHNEMHNLVYGRCYGKDKPGAVYAGI